MKIWILIKEILKYLFIQNKDWRKFCLDFFVIPRGLLDPDLWSDIICNKIVTKTINGKIKWRGKNRLKLAFLTENPPQIQNVSILPIYGIALRRLVITVAPQNDVWPQDKTYPKNAVAIRIKKIITPDNQV